MSSSASRSATVTRSPGFFSMTSPVGERAEARGDDLGGDLAQEVEDGVARQTGHGANRRTARGCRQTGRVRRWRPGRTPGPGRPTTSRGSSTLVALGAAQVHLDGRPAVAVDELDRGAVGVGEVAVAPGRDRDQHREQREALLGEPVLVALALAGLAVGLPAQHVLLDEQGEPVRQHLAGDAGVAAHVVEAADAVEHLAQHDEGPPLAEDLHGAADGAVVGREGEGGQGWAWHPC